MKTKWAEDLPYWQTGRSSDRAIEEAKNAITKNGGKITGEGFGMMNGEAAFFIQFEMHGDSFRIVEPVMKSKTGTEWTMWGYEETDLPSGEKFYRREHKGYYYSTCRVADWIAREGKGFFASIEY